MASDRPDWLKYFGRFKTSPADPCGGYNRRHRVAVWSFSRTASPKMPGRNRLVCSSFLVVDYRLCGCQVEVGEIGLWFGHFLGKRCESFLFQAQSMSEKDCWSDSECNRCDRLPNPLTKQKKDWEMNFSYNDVTDSLICWPKNPLGERRTFSFYWHTTNNDQIYWVKGTQNGQKILSRQAHARQRFKTLQSLPLLWEKKREPQVGGGGGGKDEVAGPGTRLPGLTVHAPKKENGSEERFVYLAVYLHSRPFSWSNLVFTTKNDNDWCYCPW